MHRIVGAAVFSLGLFSTSAQAADASVPASSFTVGAGVAYVPEYVGSDESRTMALIVLDYQHASGFFASSRRGLGYQGKVGPLGFSAALGRDGGRSDSKRSGRQGSDALRGMGDVAASATANFGLSYEIDGGITFSSKAVLALTHREKGNRYEFGVQAPLLKGERDQVGVFALVSYSDRKQMQTYYGVTPEQSRGTASRYQPFAASAGVDKFGIGVSWKRKINEKWSLNSTAAVMQLTGDAADSPLTKRKTTPMLATSLNYSF